MSMRDRVDFRAVKQAVSMSHYQVRACTDSSVNRKDLVRFRPRRSQGFLSEPVSGRMRLAG
jgi:hypothetical protein